MESALALPNTVEFDTKANSALRTAQEMVVRTPEDFRAGTEFLTFLRACEKESNDTFDPIIKAGRDAKARHYKPIVEAYSLAKAKLKAYAEADEVKRLELERVRNAEEQKAQEDSIIKAATEAEAEGRMADASILLESHPAHAPVIVPKSIQVDGRVFRKTHGAVVNDLAALVLAVAESIKLKDGRYPLNFLEPGQAALNARARSDKESFSVPGVSLVVK